MTTINNSSPISSRVAQQPIASESPKLSIKSETNVPTESVSVKISDDALAKLNAEINTNEPPVEAASSGSGNDVPVKPPQQFSSDTSAAVMGGGNGNEIPIKP